MGLKISSQGAPAPWNSKVVPPVTRGLEGWFTFDTDSSRFNRNRVLDKEDARVVGSPKAFAGYGRFKGLTDYLITDIPETTDQTLIVVGRAVSDIPAGANIGGDANTPFYVGNYSGVSVTQGVNGAAYGVSLYHVAPATLTGGSCRQNGLGGSTSAPNSLAGEIPTEWAIRVLRVKQSSPSRVQNVTRNTSSENTDVRLRTLSGTPFQIGSGTSAFGADVDISFVAIHSVYLTDDELSAQVVAIRKRMSRLGITV